MAGLGKTVRLMEHDYAMLHDIYEFYYIDFNSARLRYWSHIKAEEVSKRRMFNRRMRQLVEEELIAPVPFFSDRRSTIRGNSNFAYTLTKKGVQVLTDVLQTDIDWDITRKDRKSIFIQHHVNVLFFTSLYADMEKSGGLEAYYGEQSSRFQLENQSDILKDFIKPDATMFFNVENHIVPWVIEYERNSRASKTTILSKLVNHSKYALREYYKQHDIMKEHDVSMLPILLFYCENIKVAWRRLQLISSNNIRFFENGKGYLEILFAEEELVEKDPNGLVYIRSSTEMVSLNHINRLQLLVQSFMAARVSGFPAHMVYKWSPAHESSRGKIFLDGIVEMSTENRTGICAIRYFTEITTDETMRQILMDLAAAAGDRKWKQHPIIKRSSDGNPPILLCIVDTADQEHRLQRIISQMQLPDQLGWKCYISRHEQVKENPYGDHWLSIMNERVQIF